MKMRLLLLILTLALALIALPQGFALAEEEAQPAVEECEECVNGDNGEAPMVPFDGLDGDGVVDGVTPECDPVEDLELICNYEEEGQPGTFWQNGMEDYNAGVLTVNYRLDNTGPSPLVNIRVTEATATNEVKIVTELPLALGTLDPGSYLTFLLQWQLPNQNLAGFQTDIEICADCPTEEEIVQEPEPEPETVVAATERREAETPSALLPATGFSLAGTAMLLVAAGAGLTWIGNRSRKDDTA